MFGFSISNRPEEIENLLKEMEKLSKKYNINIPKGAGEKVDEIGKQIVSKHGKEELKKIAKLNFKNTEKILHN